MHSTDQYFQTGDPRIHGRVWESPDSSATPLVILHGIWESWHTFADVAPRFAQKRTVYALDLRGHGESDKPEQGYSLKDYAADGPFITIMNNELTAESWAALLNRITTPTLVLAAEPADGGWMGEASHALVRDALPSAQSVEFPGCGHHIEATCTESFIATVEQFLDNFV